MKKSTEKGVSINGEKLREMLKKEGWSQQQLSRDMGYGKQYLSVAIVSGRISKRAVRLLRAIGIDPDEYVIPEETKNVIQKKPVNADPAISYLQEKLTNNDSVDHVLPEKMKDILQEKLTETAEQPIGYGITEKLALKRKAVIQSELCLALMYRLDADIRSQMVTSPSQKQDDIVKIRRELNNLKYILQWEQMGGEYEIN